MDNRPHRLAFPTPSATLVCKLQSISTQRIAAGHPTPRMRSRTARELIDQALQIVTDRLNGHLRTQFSVDDDLVALTPLTDSEGRPAKAARNRLALFLTNIAEDGSLRNVPPDMRPRARAPQPLYLDVYFMLASGHDAEIYSEGLKQMSASLLYFQSRPLWTHQNTPELPAGIDQLALELTNLKVEETAQLWGNLGGRYVPSVMFKMRSILLDAKAVPPVRPPISQPEPTLARKQGAGP